MTASTHKTAQIIPCCAAALPPQGEGEGKFVLDSKRLKGDLEDFMSHENRWVERGLEQRAQRARHAAASQQHGLPAPLVISRASLEGMGWPWRDASHLRAR